MATYGNRFYAPTFPPCPDTQELADLGDRLMVRHNHACNPDIFIASRGMAYAGWVIGTFFNNQRVHTLSHPGRKLDAEIAKVGE